MKPCWPPSFTAWLNLYTMFWSLSQEIGMQLNGQHQIKHPPLLNGVKLIHRLNVPYVMSHNYISLIQIIVFLILFYGYYTVDIVCISHRLL